MADGEYQRLGCAHCGEAFQPTQATAIYCGRRCKVAAWRKANPERLAAHRQAERKVCAVFAGYCKECKGAFVAQRERVYCTDKCQRRAEHASTYVSQAPATRRCRVCEASFPARPHVTRPSDCCSNACEAQAKAEEKRTERLRRKALQRGAAVERVDPFKVFERDGWRCQLCGVTTPRASRGTCDDDAPELDHIVPLARGGEHSYLNTQCACRRCNQAKGDRPPAGQDRTGQEGRTMQAPSMVRATEIDAPAPA